MFMSLLPRSTALFLLTLLAILPDARAQFPPDPAELPQVIEPWINAGQPQRSMIQTIGVRFDRNVAGRVQPGTLRLRHVETGTEIDLSATELIYDPRNQSANWMLDRNPGALLPDGNYIGWIERDTLLDPARRALFEVNGLPLPDFTFSFHQLSGDSDGDRDVDFLDSSILRSAWQELLGAPLYQSFLDFDISDRVDEADRARVEATYFTLLPSRPAIHLFLQNDTGESPSDRATALYAVGMDTTDFAPVTTWTAGLNGGTGIDVTSRVGSGRAILDEAFLDQLNGAPLAPGLFQLRVEARDAGGTVVATDRLDFEYLGRVAYAPHFVSEPPPGVALGRVRAPEPLNLSTWTVESWPGSQTVSQWIIAPDGLSVEQTRNSRPSALVSDRSFQNLRVTGRFRVDTSSDDDLMGFIFGYQNNKQFYLFDWKQGSQGFVGGLALRGMSIKRVDAGDRVFTEPDFWWSDRDRENTTVLVAPNDIPWRDFQDYDISLEFSAGRIVVEVREAGTLLDRLEVEDNTFTGGRFGFYNYSQDSVIYSGFTQEFLDNVYSYDSEAIDPDGGTITYTLRDSPPGASLNPANGVLNWQPDAAGDFPFAIVATDPDGLTDVQEFNVRVSPVDLPPTVYIAKTSPALFPGDPVGIQVLAADDQQLAGVRLFIDGLEVTLDETRSITTQFTVPALIELRAVAVDSAEQVSEITSHIRVLDPASPVPDQPGTIAVAPPGQTTGTTSDLRPRVSFQAPRSTNDDPTRFIGTVHPNGGILDEWALEWAPLARVDTANLASPAVLWQALAQGTNSFDAAELATIVPSQFPDEPIAFRLRARNVTGLGSMVSVVFNPRRSSTTGPGQVTGTGSGVRPVASFNAPLSPADDRTLLRGTVSTTGTTLQRWFLDYAPQNRVNTTNLLDPAVNWTLLEQGAAGFTNNLLTTLDPADFPNQTFVFRLTAVSTGGLGSVATVVFNPVATDFSGPTDSTGSSPGTAIRPLTRITAPTKPTDDRSVLVGTVSANGGALANWIVDYAPRSQVNAEDLTDPAVAWTRLAEGSSEATLAPLASLSDPAFNNGVWILRLQAFNTNGLGSLATIQFDSGDTSTPSVALTAPAPESDIGFLTEVRGTIGAGSGVLDSWKLEIAPSEEVSLNTLNNPNASWVELGSGNSPVQNGRLGTLDPTLLRNGSYVLRLRAFNSNGRGLADGLLIHVSGEAKLGNFRLEFEDLNIPLAGVPIRVRRIYDTLNANRSGDFGHGWSLDIGDPEIRETVPDTGDSYFFATPFEIGTRVFLTNPEGRRVGFTFNVRNPRNRFLYVDHEPFFEPDPGVYDILTIAPSDYERVQVDEAGAVYTPLLPFGYNPDRYRLTTREGTVYAYDQRTGLQRITDRAGQFVTFTRSAITHSSGQAVALTRDSRGRITRITAPDGSATQYRYDTNGDLVAVEDPNGGVTSLSYLRRPAHYLDRIADPVDAARGRHTRRVIYEDGRFARVEDGDGNVIASQSNQPGQFDGTRTDALGNVTQLLYDTRGNIVREVSPTGAVTLIEYGDPANPDKETALVDPNGNRTTFSYDSRGNLLTLTAASGTVHQTTYDAFNRPVQAVIRSAQGMTNISVRVVRDTGGRPIEVRDQLGRVRTLQYDPSGRITQFTDYDGSVRTFEYDSTNPHRHPNRVTIGGDTFRFTYNSRGLPLEITDQRGNLTTFRYDAMGNLLERRTGSNEPTRFLYNSNNDVVRVVDPMGRIKEFSYDSARRLIEDITVVTDNGDSSDDIVVRYSHDIAGRLTAITDPNGRITRYEYDADGRRTAEIDPAGNRIASVYDGNGNIVRHTDRRGYVRTFAYDSHNRQIREDWLDPVTGEVVESIGAEFNAFGALTGIQDSSTRYRMTYGMNGMLMSISNFGSQGQPQVSLMTAYHSSGLISAITDNTGVRVGRSHSANGDLTGTTWSGASLAPHHVQFQHDPDGLPTEVARHAALNASALVSRTRIERDPFEGEILNVSHLNPAGTVAAPGFDFSFTRNASGRINSSTLLGNTTTYDYDNTHQLISANHSAPAFPDESYTVDANGTRIDSHRGGNVTLNGRGLPAQDQQRSYTYDAENNLVSELVLGTGNVRSFTYDHRNRVTAIITRNSSGTVLDSISLQYDPFDRLIRRDVNGAVLFTVHDRSNPWADYDGSGNVVARYLYDVTADGLLARWTPVGGTQWILADQIGSVRGVAGSDGTVQNTIEYDSFGRVVSGENNLADLRFGFTGREYLGRGLYHYRSRIYDSETGRFLSEDGVRFAAGDPNLHRYVYNDPLNHMDPSGSISISFSLPELQITQAISSTVRVGQLTISRAVIYQTIGSALITPAIDVICLALTAQGDRITAKRVALHIFIGGAQGAVGGAAGAGFARFAQGRIVFGGGAAGLYRMTGARTGILFGGGLGSLLGNGLTKLGTGVGTLAPATLRGVGQAGLAPDNDCDSFFYNLLTND